MLRSSSSIRRAFDLLRRAQETLFAAKARLSRWQEQRVANRIFSSVAATGAGWAEIADWHHMGCDSQRVWGVRGADNTASVTDKVLQGGMTTWDAGKNKGPQHR